MLGDLIAEERGKIIGIRVLPDGKIEQTSQGSSRLLGVEAASLYTFVGAPGPGGTVSGEAHGILTTKEGDMVVARIWGVGRSTGPGLKASYRGGSITQTASQKLARLNVVTQVWELESDENGNYHLKVWEWK